MSDNLAAVRERIAEMRSAAAEDRASAAGWRDDIDGPDTEHAAYNERRAESLEWAANALEAVLEALTTEDAALSVIANRRHANRGERSWNTWVDGWRDHASELRLVLEAALTRATATTEGAR